MHLIGFEKPENNYHRIPNSFTDVIANINNLAELKVVYYLLRHTWGYSEFDIPKKITVDEFRFGRAVSADVGKIKGYEYRNGKYRMDNGTKLSKNSVLSGLRRAIADGYIIEYIDNRDKARIEKFYMLIIQGKKIFKKFEGATLSDYCIQQLKKHNYIEDQDGNFILSVNKPNDKHNNSSGSNSNNDNGNSYPQVNNKTPQDIGGAKSEPQNFGGAEFEPQGGVQDLNPGGAEFEPRTEKKTIRNIPSVVVNKCEPVFSNFVDWENIMRELMADWSIGNIKKAVKQVAGIEISSKLAEHICYRETLLRFVSELRELHRQLINGIDIQNCGGWLRDALKNSYSRNIQPVKSPKEEKQKKQNNSRINYDALLES